MDDCETYLMADHEEQVARADFCGLSMCGVKKEHKHCSEQGCNFVTEREDQFQQHQMFVTLSSQILHWCELSRLCFQRPSAVCGAREQLFL